MGKPVKQGEPLFSLYSPELLAAQEEYLLALRTREALARGRRATRADGDDLVDRAPGESSSSGTSPRRRSSGSRRPGKPTKDAHLLLADLAAW